MLGSRVRKDFLKLYTLLVVINRLDGAECRILTKGHDSQTKVAKDAAVYRIRIYFRHQALKQRQKFV